MNNLSEREMTVRNAGRAMGIAAVILFAVWPGTGHAQAQDRPNLIFILTDDQGVESIRGPYWDDQYWGEWRVETPVLDQLSRQGVSFVNCRVNPNCSPTRAAMLTGRYALDTGVNGVLAQYVPPGSDPCPDIPDMVYPWSAATDRLSLQTQERTIAEVLHDLGYYTVLIDKWHVGFNHSGDRGLLAEEQGFDEYWEWLPEDSTATYSICRDEENEVGDEHVVTMKDLAVDVVTNRPDPNQPYALFYHTITPHRMWADQDGRFWWAVDPALMNLTKYYDVPEDDLPNANRARFTQNLEALDTVLAQLLVELSVVLNVPDDWPYNPDSDTVVFFVSDNGTDKLVSALGEGRAKNSLYEGGINVPLFVFGEGISDDPVLPGTVDERQVSAVDFYDTICDIVDATDAERDNDAGTFPRRGISFADGIGRDRLYEGDRTFTLSSMGNVGPGGQIWRVALIWNDYKLICNSDSNYGGEDLPGLDDTDDDEFYDLLGPAGEYENLRDLLDYGWMPFEALDAYLYMRERIVDYWPTAVSVGWEAADYDYIVEHYTANNRFVYVMHIVAGERCNDPCPDNCDEFYDLDDDPSRVENLICAEDLTEQQQAALNVLVQVAQMTYDSGQASIDMNVVDVPVSATSVLTSNGEPFELLLTVGHENVDDPNDEVEYRALLKFDVTDLDLPDGLTLDDATDAQIIVFFEHDSNVWDKNDEQVQQEFFANDSDTGLITIHEMLGAWDWSSDPWDNFAAATLGRFDPPPHIIPDPPPASGADPLPEAEIRGLPMPPGTPVSFGHAVEPDGSKPLLTLVRDWEADPGMNYGVMLKAEKLDLLDMPGMQSEDQHLHFRRSFARLRLTFDPAGQ